MKVWCVSGTSESGDDWRLLFNVDPSNQRIRQVLKDKFGNEAEYMMTWVVYEEEVIEVS